MNKAKIIDFLTSKNVEAYYKVYNKTQWYNEEQMNDFKLHKFKLLIEHCFQNVPYYRNYMLENNLTLASFIKMEDVVLFPILTKEIIQKNYNDFIPLNINSIKGSKTTQTGGTTGNILFKRNDANTRSSAWATYKRYEDWMGMRPKDKTLLLMGGHIVKGLKAKLLSELTDFINNSISVDIYNTSDETINKVISLLKKYNFSQIRSYPQFLFSVAQKLENQNISFQIKAISTTAEPILPHQRDLFRKVFHCEVFDQYGCGEIGGVAYECDKHEGLHIAEERVIVEINEINELILTDLDNFTMPFIRYWNADQAIISNKKCSCGRVSPLITQIMGRTCDYIVGLNGEFLHWAYFWHLIFDSEVAKNRNLKKFQIVQETTNLLKIRLVSDELINEEKHFFINDIQNRIGKINIEFVYETDIENTKTGKYRPVINKTI